MTASTAPARAALGGPQGPGAAAREGSKDWEDVGAGKDPIRPGQKSVVKLGPWGHGAGAMHRNCYDITVAPQRLESITVRHGDVVDALAFSYTDHDKIVHTAGPWGGDGGQVETITLDRSRSEFMLEVRGTCGSYYGHDGVAKLTFITNLKTYGPFGDNEQKWNRFSIPVKNNSSIVGFFAYTGSEFLSALGVYVKPF